MSNHTTTPYPTDDDLTADTEPTTTPEPDAEGQEGMEGTGQDEQPEAEIGITGLGGAVITDRTAQQVDKRG